MRQGQAVRVKAFGGVVLQRIVIMSLTETIVVCHPDEWKAAAREGRRPEGIGFPVSSVVRE